MTQSPWQKPYRSQNCARCELINILYGKLIFGESFAIVAGSRMGKTSMLLNIRDKFRGEGDFKSYVAYVDTDSLSEPSRDSLFKEIYEKLVKEMSIGQTVDEHQDYKVSIIELIRGYNQRDDGQLSRFVILIDNFKVISNSEWGKKFMRECRSLLTTTTGVSDHIVMVISGGSEMYVDSTDIGSPLGNILSWVELEALQFQQYSRLTSIWDKESTPDFKIQSFKLLGGHPLVVRHAVAQTTGAQALSISDLLPILEVFIESHPALFESFWKQIGDDGRSVCIELFQKKFLSIRDMRLLCRSQASRTLKMLLHSGFLCYRGTDGIEFSGKPLELWMKENINMEQNPKQSTKNVFISYSHKDELYRSELHSHLANLIRQGLVETWHDHKILPGSVLDEEINTALEKADIILLMISADFINSDYCYSIEMKTAIKKHNEGKVRVIPIIVRPVDWEDTPFSSIKALPKDGKAISTWADRDEALSSIASEIRKVIKSQQQKPSKPE